MRNTLQTTLVCLIGLPALLWAGRYEQYTEQYKQPARPVQILTAGSLGGSGTEWLVGGGFLPDGRVVVAGNAWGPALTLGGKTVPSLGRDGRARPIPPAPKNRKGKEQARSFKELDGTVWVAVLDERGAKIERAVRLPWSSGSAVDAVVDDKGGIYVAGFVGERFSSIGTQATQLKSIAKPGATDDGIGKKSFVVKFNKNLAVEWVRTVDEPNYSVRLRAVKGFGVHFKAVNAYALDSAGKLIQAIPATDGNAWATTYNPHDGGIAQGYFKQHHTGREPWHQPWLEVTDGDGVMTRLYRWNGRLVGHDRYRLVSDSKVLRLHYGDDGYLYIAGWSDGGNTVYQRKPYDLSTPHGAEGLPFSAWGAGALSLGHLVRLNLETYDVQNYTVWAGYTQKNTPNSARILQVRDSACGDMLLAGRASWGLIQTGDKLSDCEPAGAYVTILDKTFKDIRFSSVVPAAGRAEINHKENWGVASHIVKNRERVLYTTSVEKEAFIYSETPTKPAHTPGHVQSAYGGGATDGYFIILDLGAATK